MHHHFSWVVKDNDLPYNVRDMIGLSEGYVSFTDIDPVDNDVSIIVFKKL